MFPGTTIVVLPNGRTFASLDDKEMEAKGWRRIPRAEVVKERASAVTELKGIASGLME